MFISLLHFVQIACCMLQDDLINLSNDHRFSALFGVTLSVSSGKWSFFCVHLPSDVSLNHFLWSLPFLKGCKTEDVITTIFKVYAKTYLRETWSVFTVLGTNALVGTVKWNIYIFLNFFFLLTLTSCSFSGPIGREGIPTSQHPFWLTQLLFPYSSQPHLDLFGFEIGLEERTYVTKSYYKLKLENWFGPVDTTPTQQ